MGLDWTIGGDIMLGIIANSRSRVAAVVVPDYTQAVAFNGGTYIYTTTASAPAQSDNATFSFWFLPTNNGTIRRIMFAESPSDGWKAQVWLNADNAVYVEAVQPGSFVQKLRLVITGPFVESDGWTHIVGSFDMSSTSTRGVYVNGAVASVTWVTYVVGSTIGFDCQKWSYGAAAGWTQHYNGDLAQFYFATGQYVDLSVLANREKFFNNGIVDFGSDGSTPTGTQPDMYFKGDASTINAGTNAGSLTGFAAVGAVTDSLNEPVEVRKYRYWRLYITENNGHSSGEKAISELQFHTSIGGADVLNPAGVWSVDSAKFGNDFIIDNNYATFWQSIGSAPAWFVYDFGAGNEVEIVEYTIAAAFTLFAPKAFVLQRSWDGINWTTIDERTAEINWTIGLAGERTYQV